MSVSSSHNNHEHLVTTNHRALGHPAGCTGVRQVVTAFSELRRQGKKIAVTAMCVGTVSIEVPRARFVLSLTVC